MGDKSSQRKRKSSQKVCVEIFVIPKVAASCYPIGFTLIL